MIEENLRSRNLFIHNGARKHWHKETFSFASLSLSLSLSASLSLSLTTLSLMSQATLASHSHAKVYSSDAESRWVGVLISTCDGADNTGSTLNLRTSYLKAELWLDDRDGARERSGEEWVRFWHFKVHLSLFLSLLSLSLSVCLLSVLSLSSFFSIVLCLSPCLCIFLFLSLSVWGSLNAVLELRVRVNKNITWCKYYGHVTILHLWGPNFSFPGSLS